MDLSGMIQAGANNPALLFLMALLLGGFHGLEPGHSKTMIAAYIVAIRGSVHQAVLLGISAAISHSVIVWILAVVALTYGNALIGEELEPWFMIGSGGLVLGIALWMALQLHPRSASGHGHEHGQNHHHDHHHHDHAGGAHAMAHAREIEFRLQNGRTSTVQTILFGLSGGLIPCPSAITVFLLCLQLGKVTLGITLVSAFSIGLAATLVLVGAAAAVGLREIGKRTSKLDRLFKVAPYLSVILISAVGCLMIYGGWRHLGAVHF